MQSAIYDLTKYDYKKLLVFAKQGAYKMLRVTLLQKGGPKTNFSYKNISPDHFIPYTCSFSLFVVEIPSGMDVLCTHAEPGWHPEVSSPGTSQAKALCYQKKCGSQHPKT